jgi:TonB family protein
VILDILSKLLRIRSNKFMSFSGTAVEQREQELKTIKTFLVYSLLGSLALHISLLVSGLGNLLLKVPEIAEEPLEVTILDTPLKPEPIQEVEPPQPDVVEKPQIVNNAESQPTAGLTINRSEPKPEPQQSKVVPTQPVQKIEPLKPLPSIPKDNVPEKNLAPQSQPQNILSQPSSSDSTTVDAAIQPSANLSKLLAGIRDQRGSQTATQPSEGTGQGNGAVGSNSSGAGGSSGGNGNNTGNDSGRDTTVATAPTTPKLRTNSGNGDGRAACRECNNNYPDWARRRGVEGRVEVAVDTDANGNVTNVRLLRSSGNDRLDAEHLERARKWKLKQSSNGRQGVTIGTEYAIAGSQRHRQLQERKRQRETEARNSESTNTASNSSTTTPKRRRRLVASTSQNVASSSSTTPTRRIRRRRDLATSTESPRRQQVVNNSSSSEPTRKRRRRRLMNQTPSVNSTSNTSSQPTRRRRRLEQPVSSEQSAPPSSSSGN